MVICVIARYSLIAFLSALVANVALAQDYPARPVRMVVPFPPGGGVDATARVLGQKLTEIWRKQVVADNRTGAGTTIGTEIAARAAPDGYTLLLTNNALAISAGLYQKLKYDTGKDLLPVMEILRSPFVLVVPATSSAKTTKELIAQAKAKPGELALANTGIGSGPHMAGVLLGIMTGTTLNHIPYKGGGPALTDVMGGQVPAFFAGVASSARQIKAGKVRALGFTTTRRTAALPDTPTVAESGFPGYEVDGWYGLLAPRATPPAIIRRFNAELASVVSLDEIKERLLAAARVSTPAEFQDRIAKDVVRWADVVKKARITPV